MIGRSRVARRGAATDYIVVGAHYDGQGKGFPSASDNAAGVAVLTVLKFESLSESTRNIVGFVLIGYGIFRLYVLRKRSRM